MRLAAVSGTLGCMFEQESARTAKAFTAEHPTAPELRANFYWSVASFFGSFLSSPGKKEMNIAQM